MLGLDALRAKHGDAVAEVVSKAISIEVDLAASLYKSVKDHRLASGLADHVGLSIGGPSTASFLADIAGLAIGAHRRIVAELPSLAIRSGSLVVLPQPDLNLSLLKIDESGLAAATAISAAAVAFGPDERARIMAAVFGALRSGSSAPEVIRTALSGPNASESVAESVPPGFRGTLAQYLSGVASVIVTRSRALTEVARAQAESTGLLPQEFVFVVRNPMDELTCEICEAVAGSEFTLAELAPLRAALLAADGSDAIKAASPWLRESEIDQILFGIDDNRERGRALAQNGVGLPPYHFLCRDTLVRRDGR